MPEPVSRKRSWANLARVKSPISLPRSLSIGVRPMRPTFGILPAITRGRARLRRRAVRSMYLAKLEISIRPRLVAHGLAPPRRHGMRVGAAEGDGLDRLGASGREPERVLLAPAHAHDGVLGLELVVDRRGLQRPRCRQLLVREGDAEAPAVVLAHLGVGVARRGPGAVAGDVHGPDVEAGIALGHPVGERQAHAAALAEAGHDGAGAPVVGQAADRADQRVAVGREGEGAVDDPLDAGPADRREVLEADLERGGDAVEVLREQLGREVPGRGRARTRARPGARRCRAACRRVPGADRSRPRSRWRGAARSARPGPRACPR
jgi:hypothetical protein